MKTALIVCVGSATAQQWNSHPLMMDNPPPAKAATDELKDEKLPAPQFFIQAQDHFDGTNTNTWLQAYYVNDKSWVSGSDAPIFLCVGGEGPPLDGSVVVSSVHCNVAVEWAVEKKALMFAIEHRYYGCHLGKDHCPVDSFDDEKNALRFLSSHQAVEDVATFVQTMNKKYGLTAKNKWVTWGGSYPGMLAGWSRLKHPELIHAAVASSAPVHAKLDMSEYNDAVTDAYAVSDNNVGGSTPCQQAIRAGHKTIEDALKEEGGVAKVEKMLGLSNGTLATKSAQADYFGDGLAYFPSQGNDPACDQPACNIKHICEIMTDSSAGDEVQRLLKVRKAQSGTGLKSVKPADVVKGEPDYWFYQTCTEFGFYQSCEVDSNCMFVRGLVTVESQAEGCQTKYNIGIDQIQKNINATNAHYGGLNPTDPASKLGSCVVWPNGEVDPWARLSVLKSPGLGQPVVWVDGASHHAWTHPSAPTDQPSVVSARKTLRDQVEQFLGQDCSAPSSIVV